MQVGSQPGSRKRGSGHARLVQALGSVGSALANTADYEQALSALTASMCHVVDAKGGGVMLYDEETDELVLQKPAFGIHSDDLVAAYRVPISAGGNAVRVFLTQTSYIANEARNDPRFIQRFVEMFDTWSTLTVPLFVGDKTVGIFHAINKKSGPFTDEDRITLEQLAPLLASGIHAARAFRKTQEEHRRLERAMFIHRELCKTASEGGGLVPLCAVLTKLLGRPALVFDSDHHLVANGGSDDAGVDAAREDLATRDGKACVKPIMLGDELAGYLVIGRCSKDIDLADRRALDSAVSILALELLSERATFELKKRLVSDLLQDLASHRTADGAQVLRRLGCTAPAPWRAVCVRVHAQSARGVSHLAHVTPTVDRSIADAFSAAGIEGTLAPWRNGFVILLGASDVARLRDGQLADEVAVALGMIGRDPGVRLRLQWGVGEAAASEKQIGESIATAEQAIVAAERLAIAARPVFFDELGIYRLLLSTDPARDHAAFVERVLGGVRAVDAKKRTATLAETLDVLVDSGFRLPAAAERLDVHVNTLKYRLRKLSEILGGDPSRGELRLELELATRIVKLQRAVLHS